MEKGKLYLIPVPLGDDALHTLPAYVAAHVHHLRHFVAERAKTARHFIKATRPPYPLSELTVEELNDQTPPQSLPQLLEPALQGHDIGLLSEAGCPGVADPGAALVALAHQRDIVVVPLVGPSAILLGLMASGLNGQHFCFHGYLSPKPDGLARDLRRLEQQSRQNGQTQLFIETPYRNEQLIQTALKTLHDNTKFCIAADITLPSQYIRTLPVHAWRTTELPPLHKRPAVFLLNAQ